MSFFFTNQVVNKIELLTKTWVKISFRGWIGVMVELTWKWLCLAVPLFCLKETLLARKPIMHSALQLVLCDTEDICSWKEKYGNKCGLLTYFGVQIVVNSWILCSVCRLKPKSYFSFWKVCHWIPWVSWYLHQNRLFCISKVETKMNTFFSRLFTGKKTFHFWLGRRFRRVNSVRGHFKMYPQ